MAAVHVAHGPGMSRREFKVKGPVKFEADTVAIGGEQVHFTVDWHPLNSEGKVLSVSREDKPLRTRSVGSAGFAVDQEAPPAIVDPPFEWPHGFRATVSIPSQQATHGNTTGALLRVFVPKDGVLK